MGSMQRGGIIRKNDNGTLERIGKTNTYVGSATLDSGRVITQRFRCKGFKEDEVAERWEKWQCKELSKETNMEKKTTTKTTTTKETAMDKKNCPFSGTECGKCAIYSTGMGACSILLGGVGLYGLSQGRLEVGEQLELIALAIAETKKPTKTVEAKALTAADGVEAYLADKKFLDFVNLHSKTVYAPYRKFCEEKGYPQVKEAEFTKEIKARFPELKGKSSNGGTVFLAA